MASHFTRIQNEYPEGRIGASLTPLNGEKCAILFAGAISKYFLQERERDTSASNDEVGDGFPLHTRNDLFLCNYDDTLPGPASFRWFPLTASNPPEGRVFHASTLIEAQNELWLFVYGGKTNSTTLCTDELYLLCLSCDENQLQWVKLSCKGNSPGRRFGHTMIFMESSLILFGGHNGDTALNDVWIIDFRISSTLTNGTPSLEWKEINFYGALRPLSRYHHAAVSYSDGLHTSMIIYGGCIEEDLPRSRVYSLQRNEEGHWYWRILPVWVKCLREQRSHHTLVALNDKILIVGGIGESRDASSFETTLKVAVYNMKTFAFHYYHDSVERVPEISNTFRFLPVYCLQFGHQSWLLGNRVYSWGGCSPVHSIPFDSMDFEELLITDLLSGTELAALHYTRTKVCTSGVPLAGSNPLLSSLLSKCYSEISLSASKCPSSGNEMAAHLPASTTDISHLGLDKIGNIVGLPATLSYCPWNLYFLLVASEIPLNLCGISGINERLSTLNSMTLVSSAMRGNPPSISSGDPATPSSSRGDTPTTSDFLPIGALSKDSITFLPVISSSNNTSPNLSLCSYPRTGRTRPLRAAASAALEGFKKLPAVISLGDYAVIENPSIEPLSSSVNLNASSRISEDSASKNFDESVGESPFISYNLPSTACPNFAKHEVEMEGGEASGALSGKVHAPFRERSCEEIESQLSVFPSSKKLKPSMNDPETPEAPL
ncbi:hypothetical protein IE077_004151 [Cardiosporidium cionae]|uniref:Uncharacterized protein n=1 Tax=Cardiosporidium cionae TaxID=476202 RepID=A0ABQ7J6R0_9APIC|nr:hypothetical protein IE077_004151 [Cardiosporidium cionae]|eukprot:KAF8819669.1 hypothetical protein IE077_004151 [Cardiosporidium cionae]